MTKFGVYSHSVVGARGKGKFYACFATLKEATEIVIFLKLDDNTQRFYAKEMKEPVVLSVDDFKKQYGTKKTQKTYIDDEDDIVYNRAFEKFQAGELTEEQYRKIVGPPAKLVQISSDKVAEIQAKIVENVTNPSIVITDNSATENVVLTEGKLETLNT